MLSMLFIVSILPFLIPGNVAFCISTSNRIHTRSSKPWVSSRLYSSDPLLSSTDTSNIETTTSTFSTPMDIIVDPQEAVKLFGRLAEKYIMLDPSGGMCCYSACTDCEYRLPDGGYRMAEQSSSRPKWIVAYDHRTFPSSGKEHVSKWSIDLFPSSSPVVSVEEFVVRVSQAKYTPPLGGPFVSASAAQTVDETLVHKWFQVLSQGKDKLTKHKMGVRIKQLAKGEEGLTWNEFLLALSQ